ncbi:hypothetical protein KUCAC02_002331, partial [Chaenocephalus aceratus]
PRQVQGKSSWSVQGESQTNSGSPKTAPPEREKAGESEECVSPKTAPPEREKAIEREEYVSPKTGSPEREKATRWWAKHEALKKVFGSFGKPQDGLYIDVLLTLSAIQKQTAGLDILSAHRMVASTQDTLKSLGRDVDSVKKAADTFVNWTHTEIQERDDTDIEVEATLPQKRRRMKKVLPGEMAQDETLDDAEKSYESALQDLSKCLQGFDSRATKENMQAELKSFALQWNRLKASPLAEYKARTVEDGSG